MSKRKKLKDPPQNDFPLPKPKKLPGGQLRLTALTLRPSSGVPQPADALRPPNALRALAPAPQRPPAPEPQTAEWVQTHRPQSLEQIAVAKKKVQEAQQWLEPFRDGTPHPAHARVLLLTGPPGCGKTTLVQLLAEQLGFELCEWHPSANVSWSEVQHMQQGALQLQYTSKLREFEDFAQRAKLPALALAPSAARQPSAANAAIGAAASAAAAQQQPASRQRPKLLMVEDLPHASGGGSRGQLADALRDLANAARMPVVVMATESTGSGRAEDADSASGGWHGLHKDLVAALEACKARQLHLNPVTTAATAKCLSGIAVAEARELAPAEAKQLAMASAGDLRNAVAMLQMLLCGTAPVSQTKGSKGAAAKRKRASGGAAAEPAERPIAFKGRDQGLTLFHALGKLLYNKRVEPDNPAQPSGAASQPGGSEKQRPAGVSAPRSQPSGVSQPSGGSSRGSASQPAPAQHAFGGSAAHSSQSAAMSSAASQPNGNLHSSAPAWSASAQRAQQQQHSAAEPDVIYLTDDPADAPMATAAEPEPPDIDARYQRLPLQCNPEAVLMQAGLEASSVAAFLHENMPDFIGDDGMQSAADVFDYLSESDRLTVFRRNDQAATGAAEVDEYAVTSMADSVAALVAAHGVLFGNVDQAPRRFMQMRAPVLYIAQRGLTANSAQMAAVAELMCTTGSLSGLSIGTAAAQVMPFVRAIAAAAPRSHAALLRPARWQRLWNGRLVEDVLGSGGAALPALQLQDGGLSGGEEEEGFDAVEMV